MSITDSVLAELLQFIPSLRSQMYFKSSLTALSHAMEDLILCGKMQPLTIVSFQKERFYRQEAHRYRRIGKISSQVYILSAPETDFVNGSGVYETVAFAPTDELCREWHLVVISPQYAGCLICLEKTPSTTENNQTADNSRRFEGIWTQERQVSEKAATILLERILTYRPELADKIELARRQYLQQPGGADNSSEPFVERLVVYLQAGQYKLIKANRSLKAKEEKERLLNDIMVAIRRSLEPEEILQVAVEKLGLGLGVCRCLVYRCKETDASATIEHEFVRPGISSIKGRTWPIRNNPLFREVVALRQSLEH